MTGSSLLSRSTVLVAMLLAAALAPISGLVLADEPRPRTYTVAEALGSGLFAVDGETYLGVRLEEEIDHPEGGARVAEVVDDSPAAAAGLQEDDIVVRFDAKTIRGPVALTQAIHGREPGDRVSVTVVRGGREQTLEAELGRRPGLVAWTTPSAPGAPAALLERFSASPGTFSVAPEIHGLFSRIRGPRLGVQLVLVTPELREHLGGDRDHGVLVSKVLHDTPALRAGILVGDLIVSVDGHTVQGADDILGALRETEGRQIDVELIRNGRRKVVEVQVPESDETGVPTGPRALLRVAPPAPAPLRLRVASIAGVPLPELPALPAARPAAPSPAVAAPAPQVPRPDRPAPPAPALSSARGSV